MEHNGSSNRVCRATIRVGGLPVYSFQLEDISTNGTCFLVKDDPDILRHLSVGQKIDIRIPPAVPGKPAVSQDSRIIYISKQNTAQYRGFRIVTVQVLNRL